jgi:hypothetical protein
MSPDNKLMVVSLKLGTNSIEPSAPRELFPLLVADIGFQPKTSIEEGIQRFVAWYKGFYNVV